MKLTSRLGFALLASLLCAAGFGAIAVLVGTERIASFDRAIIDFWQSRESATLTNGMKAFTAIGSGIPVVVISIAIMLFLFFVLNHRKELILFAFVLAGSEILNVALKLVFHRERPSFHRLVQASGYSFPSGHSMGAFSLYGIAAFLLWKHISSRRGRTLLILVSCALVLAIGISRIYLGVHYPSDVLAGYLASGFWLTASITVYQRYMERAAERANGLRK
ncbi:phosphatase PAP2 family protein [Cohnella thailandensis]|uniref:Phosphatase PAP2 family protein n=1 Tax=Cohnella thailandensis TaxID=557557 RepID=A0A841T203_9BACL|nr:phosphatase PAP2 family protein [Cohnella thailandensis]MBB6638423.1 phosphatase PAP2 family protein [Cohnella thailandensis]MBP1977099.1 undecaprenyl-diphosphatase [Cohnella thailandensis]